MSNGITIDFIFKIEWVRAIWKSGSKWPVYLQNWIFWQIAASYCKMQESRPPLKFNFTSRIPSPYPQAPFLKLRNSIVFFHVSFSLFVAARWKFASWLSNCSNLINFKAKINCNTTRQNDLKWRKTCTGLKFDLVYSNGPQTKFIFDSLYEHPVHASYTRLFTAGSKLLSSFDFLTWRIHLLNTAIATNLTNKIKCRYCR